MSVPHKMLVKLHIHAPLFARDSYSYVVFVTFFFIFALRRILDLEHRSTILTFICAYGTRSENIATYFGYSPNTVDDMNKQVTPAT